MKESSIGLTDHEISDGSVEEEGVGVNRARGIKCYSLETQITSCK